MMSSVYDPVTDTTTVGPVDTPLLERYSNLRTAYQNASLAYNSLANRATTSTDPAVIGDWNLNGPIYRAQVQQAYNKWVAAGKNTIETCYAVIDQLTGRDPALPYAQARDRLTLSRRFDLNQQLYHFTKFFPSRFYEVPDWPKFSFRHTEVHTTDTSTSTSWGGRAGVGWGLWSFGASAQYSSQRQTSTCDTQDFQLTMDMVRLPIRRSWFTPSILTSRGWKSNLVLHDGGLPPQGAMIGYVTDLIVARKVDCRMDMTWVHL